MSMRVFASIDLPESFASDIEAVQSRIDSASGIKLTDPTQAHITLKFFGDVSSEKADDISSLISSAVSDAGTGSFDVSITRLGVFPSLDYISIVWLGVGDGANEITTLHEEIEKQAVNTGFDPEDNDFTPHVTIARMKHAGGKESVQDMVRDKSPDIGSFNVDTIQLKESTLTQDGPVYSTIESFEL